jgi:hypothetical protein
MFYQQAFIVVHGFDASISPTHGTLMHDFTVDSPAQLVKLYWLRVFI